MPSWHSLTIAGLVLAFGLGFGGGSAPAKEAKRFSGKASFYDKYYKGRTASGAPYDARKFTAAHRTLPFGTRLRVTEARSKRSVTVIVNDRGPFIKDRVLDLSTAAAEALKMTGRGVVQVVATVE